MHAMGRRTIVVEEGRAIPPASLLLGFGAMLPLAAGAAVAWASPRERRLARERALLWGGSVLVFLAGVRRGLSFRTPGGATPGQFGTMLSLFGLGLGSLGALRTGAAPVLQGLGYAAVAVLDPLAAGREEAPAFFARLRPAQMAIPLASLVALALLPRDKNF